MRWSQVTMSRLFVLACILSLTVSAFAQTKTPVKNSSAPVATASTAAKADPPALASRLVNAVTDGIDDHSDYVPCFFSKRQLLELRPKPEFSVLSSADAEALRASVIDEAMNPDNAAGFTTESPQQFAAEIGRTVFEGLTPSQALTKVLELLNPSTTPTISHTVSLKGLTGQQFAEIYALPNKQKEVTTAIANQTPPAEIESEVNAEGKKAIEESAVQVKTTKDNVAGAARTNLSLTQRPKNIGCSMSILSYETMRKAFGETMADEYLGVQIAVRNVDPDQEFLVQSAEFKVDDDINGRIGRYFSGVDKLTAREYMLSSRDFGKRNLMIHTAQGTAAILSAVVPFTGPFVKQFSGVYSGALVGALGTVFPDHNTEQLKLIDDEGFSNARTDRTVVPKSGTVEFVMFI